MSSAWRTFSLWRSVKVKSTGNAAPVLARVTYVQWRASGGHLQYLYVLYQNTTRRVL